MHALPYANCRVRLHQLVVALALLLTTPGPANAQQMRDLVEEALDQNVTQIEIKDLPLREALGQLQQQTGLRFALPNDVVDSMPYGERTRVSITLQDTPLRRGLAQVLDGLGLQMRVDGDKVHIEWAPVLERVGRRLTITEVKLLGTLASGPWSSLNRSELPLHFQFDPQKKPQEAFDRAIEQAQGPNALRQLEATAEALGWVWVPQGEVVVFLSKGDDMRRRLDRALDMSYQHVPLDELLVDLGRRIRVTMLFEPGVLQRVAARERMVDLIQKQTSVRQTLERIGGNTGLRYEVVSDGVQIMGPAEAASPRLPSSSPNRLIITIGPDGKPTVGWVVPLEDLPAEIRRALEEMFRNAIEQLPKAPLVGPGER